ncbi:response regulator transcription factor [Martelella sp. FOR1707]
MTEDVQTIKHADGQLKAIVRILLVEDDEDLRQSLAEYLKLSGYDVTEASSGLECYRALRNATFEVAIIDVNLPDCSGFELVSDLAGEAEGRGIILLTARTGRDDRVRGYQQGADLYLTKPVDGLELVLAIRNLVRRLPEPRKAGDDADVAQSTNQTWRLDRLNYVLTAPDDIGIDLTGREMQLMAILVEARGDPVSRSKLASELGYDDKPETRGIDAIVHRLKQKAASSNVDLPIKSIRSIGISFAATTEVV